MGLVSFPALLLLAAPSSAEDWPAFRGPDGAGRSTAEISAVFNAEDYAWRIELAGEGHSSPVVAGEKIFRTCVDEAARLLACYSTQDGAEFWVHVEEFEPHGQHRFNSFASTTPAADAERVVVVDTSGEMLRVQAFDHEGELLWRAELGAT